MWDSINPLEMPYEIYSLDMGLIKSLINQQMYNSDSSEQEGRYRQEEDSQEEYYRKEEDYSQEGDYQQEEDYQQNGNNQDYMEEVLESTLKEAQYPEMETGTVFQGYRSIHIQTLAPNTKEKLEFETGKNVWLRDKVKEVYCYQESCPLGQTCHNGFFWAFYRAYYRHGDVKITPDDVWSTIHLYFSAYVNKHAETLKNAFVSHEGKKELTIETRSQISEYQWNEFFDKVILAIKENTVKGVTQKFQCDFSTTNKFFELFSTATIMNSYKKYFQHKRYISLCGINNIHMAGTLEDWQKVLEKTKGLYQYDIDGKLKLYLRRLEPVLKQFIQTYRGNVSEHFWDNIYSFRRLKSGYEITTSISGWILRFFTLERSIQSEYELGLETFDIPIKVINELTGQAKMMNILGGTRGVSIQGNVYRPHFSFSIVEYEPEEQ